MHGKHRERLRKKFSAAPSIMEKHEILELLLTFCIPRKNTNNIAHELLDAFGSFSEILSSNSEDLKTVKGVGENTALFLKVLKIFLNVCLEEKNKLSRKINLNSLTLEDAKNIMLTKFINAYEEKVALAIFNAKRKIVFCDFIESGSLKFVDVDFRKIVSLSFKYNAKYVIIAHNHPSKIALPSKEDITITSQLEFTLKNLGINLLDHLIVCSDNCISLRECKVISEKGQSEKGFLQKVGWCFSELSEYIKNNGEKYVLHINLKKFKNWIKYVFRLKFLSKYLCFTLNSIVLYFIFSHFSVDNFLYIFSFGTVWFWILILKKIMIAKQRIIQVAQFFVTKSLWVSFYLLSSVLQQQ